MTSDQKLCYSEGTLWRNRCKGQCIGYAGEVVRADPYSYIPEDQARSLHTTTTASASASSASASRTCSRSRTPPAWP